MLARREFSTTQIRDRLRQRGFEEAAITNAIVQLQHEGALDDHRTATAFARTSLELKLRGRQRVVRDLEERLGVDRAVARAAVEKVYADVEERELVERVLDRRHMGLVRSTRTFRRLYNALLRQGFEPSVIVGALKARSSDIVCSMDH